MTDYVPVGLGPGLKAMPLSYRSKHGLGTHAVYLSAETKTALIVVMKSQKGTDFAIAAGVVGWFDQFKERSRLYVDLVDDGRLIRRLDLAAIVDVVRPLNPQQSKRDGMPDFFWLNPDDFGTVDDDVQF